MSEIRWPNFTPTVGQAWPKAVADGGTQLGGGGFNTGDCKDGTHPNLGQRFSWVQDPLGSGLVIARIEVRQGDVADLFGGCRAELWDYPPNLAPGQTWWNAWLFLLNDDYGPDPVGWGQTIGQIHPADGLSPVHGFYLTPRGMEYQVRSVEDWVWKPQIVKGQRVYLLTRTEYVEAEKKDSVQLWATIGNPPDPNSPATRKWAAKTIRAAADGRKNSWPKAGEYRDPSSKGTNVIHLYGYGQALTAEQAIANARFHTAAPPPTDTMPVTSTPNSDGTITLHWTPVTGAGYELWIDGVRQKSFSRDQGKSSWKVAKLAGQHKYEVRAVGYGASGSVTL